MDSNQQPELPESLEATVGTVVWQGNRSYAVTYPLDRSLLGEGECITFSIFAWRGGQLPRKEEIVVLEEIRPHRKGWRAHVARPKTAASNQQRGDQ